MPTPRPDVTALRFVVPPTPTQIAALRRFATAKGWQLSRQNPAFVGKQLNRVYLGDIVPVWVEVAYHATRRASVKSILKRGLLPSVPERQTTDDDDGEGRLFLCEQLGTEEDLGHENATTADWWRHHLSLGNRFSDPDWVILQVDVGRVPGARLYRDMWSESVVVVDKVLFIPPSVISIVVS